MCCHIFIFCPLLRGLIRGPFLQTQKTVASVLEFLATFRALCPAFVRRRTDTELFTYFLSYEIRETKYYPGVPGSCYRDARQKTSPGMYSVAACIGCRWAGGEAFFPVIQIGINHVSFLTFRNHAIVLLLYEYV